MSDCRRGRYLVHGEVQGVGFRAFARHHAQRFNLSGWVRNLSDGTVEIEVEGPNPAVADFLAEIRKGPRAGYVTEIECRSEEPVEIASAAPFAIRF